MGDNYMDTKNISNGNQYCVYCHLNKINGKRYIGCTKYNLKTRSGPTGHGYSKNPNFWPEIQKYGWDNFNHIVLKSNLTVEEADYYEAYYIKLFKTQDINFGYNISSGGIHNGGGHPQSEETKAKISKNGKGKGMTGKNHSIDTKQKMSKSQKGNTNVLGKKWINNGIETKYINAEDLEQYINDGWVYGRLANGKIGKHTKPTIPWNKGKTLKGD